MLYALSGTQGSGKTTLLKELELLGYNVVQRKTSRSILEDWNLTLSEIYSNDKLMIDFQIEVLKRKYEDDSKIANCHGFKDEIWFTDRSFIDLLAYATVILGPKNHNKEFLQGYYEDCKNFQSLYHKIFYINSLDNIEEDGIRSSCKSYNDLVDYSMFGYLNKFKNNHTVINKKSINDRTIQILNNL